MSDFSTYTGCFEAVRHNGYELQHVPEDMITPELCLAAVESIAGALIFVPQKMKTYELCLNAVQRNGYALLHVPIDISTPELCVAAVKMYGAVLKFIPDYMKTVELCLTAVRETGLALQYVPEQLQSDEIIEAALLNNPEAVNFAKKRIIIHCGAPKKMPSMAYDTLQMGYDEETAIQDGELMVDFHDEFQYGRFYRKKTFEDLILPNKQNGYTKEIITEYTVYQAIV